MDLHNFPITPKENKIKRKQLLSSRKKSFLKEYTQEKNVSIEWGNSSGSEAEQRTPKKPRTDEFKSCRFDIRSTPSGSPILKKKLSARKIVHKSGNLVPISPITPGVAVGQSFSRSCFSLHVSDGSINKGNSFDNTVLAVPLDESNEDVLNPLISEDEDETISSAQHHAEEEENDHITAPSTNDQSSFDQISQVPSEHTASVPTSPKPKTADMKGSSWLQGVCEKINKERKQEEKSISEKISDEICDSAKKLKIKRGGLAEQLLKVLKKENSEQAIFMHQIKSNSYNYSNSLHLQVLSSTTETNIYILECKVYGSDEYYTTVLSKEIVEKHSIQLSSRFTIFPPWLEQQMEGYHHPILISITKILVSEEHEIDYRDTGEETSSSPQESLLSAIQQHSIAGFVNIVATLQRIFIKNNNSELIHSLLLEDGFGVFMELVVDDELCHRVDTKDVLTHGEGQRVIVRNVSIEGRITKTQLSSLFEVIESVWSWDGRGLMHVSQSQSQELKTNANELIHPPSFCYLLSAETSHAKLSLMQDTSKLDFISQNKCSALNRPRDDGLSQCDVLYKPPQNVTLNNIKDYSGRVSVLCKLVFHFQSNISTHEESSCLTLLVMDETSVSLRKVKVQMSCVKSHVNLNCGSVVVLKDASVKQDLLLCMDGYSHLHCLNETNINQISTLLRLPQESLHEKLLLLQQTTFPDTFPAYDNATKPHSVVTVAGCVKKVAYTSNKSMYCAHCGNEDHFNKHENCSRCGQEMLFKGSKAPCVLLSTADDSQLVIKLLRKRWMSLTENVSKLSDLKSVYGSSLAPLTCAIYQINNAKYLNEIWL